MIALGNQHGVSLGTQTIHRAPENTSAQRPANTTAMPIFTSKADQVTFGGGNRPKLELLPSRFALLRFAGQGEASESASTAAESPFVIPATKKFVYDPNKNLLNVLKGMAEREPNAEIMEISRVFPIQTMKPSKELSTQAKRIAKQMGISKDSAEALLTNNDDSLTAKQLWDGVGKVAAGLKRQYGIKPGDRIALIENNTYEFMKMFFGAMAVGASVVPINILAIADPADREKKLGHMLKASDSKLLFIGNDSTFVKLRKLRRGLDRKKFVVDLTQSFFSPPCIKKRFHKPSILLNSLPKGMKIITNQDLKQFDSLQPLPEKEMNLNPDPNQEALMLFTSGTTSLPKGVPTTYKGLQHNTESLSDFTPEITPRCNMLSALPFFHVFSLSIMLTSINKALQKDDEKKEANITLLPSLRDGLKNLPKFQDTMQLHRIRVLPLIPGGLQRLLKEPEKKPGTPTEFSIPLDRKLRNLRLTILGGDALGKDLYDTLKKVAPEAVAWEGYGQTEGWIYTLNKSGDYGHVGRPVSPSITIEIRDPDPEGNGEIWVQTPSSAGKYVGVPEEESKEVFFPDDWIKTGDIGKIIIGKDGKKNLKITGRVSDVIKRNGERLSPEDFNSQIREILPVSDVMTLAMFTKDSSTEEKITSIVLLPQNSTETESSLKEKLMKAAKEEKIAFRYVPHYILPLKSDKFPEGFISIAGKKQTKVARQYIKELVEQNVIEFTKDGVKINQPDKLKV